MLDYVTQFAQHVTLRARLAVQSIAVALQRIDAVGQR